MTMNKKGENTMAVGYAYLMDIDSDKNCNKFYEMKDTGNGFFLVTYGRVGASGVSRQYPLHAWDRKYREKIRKGYVDRTELRQQNLENKQIAVADPDVRDFLEIILGSQNRNLQKKYSIRADTVTGDMVNEARSLLQKLSDTEDIPIFNQVLLDLFSVLPRRMHRVDEYLLHPGQDKSDLLLREYELLDQMEAKVTTSISTGAGEKDDFLSSIGLDIALVTSPERLHSIKRHLGEMEPRFYRAFRVHNHKTDKDFRKTMEKDGYSKKDIHYLFHGSRTENWFSIIKKGLVLHPKAVRSGSMFGSGLYFANKAKKSAGYISLAGFSCWAKQHEDKGFLGVYKVLYKKPMHIAGRAGYSFMDSERIKPYDGLFVHKNPPHLYNDEIIIYTENQCTLQYIIELR